MTTYFLKSDPAHRHATRRRGDTVHVGDVAVALRRVDGHTFVAPVGERARRLHAVAHGDTVHVQLDGRACTIERVDPLRAGSGAGADHGGALAPMPGVVIARLVEPGCVVRCGDALLVIESMKMQTTITAPADGVVDTMPFAVGQTFQRGVVLAHIRVAATEVPA